MKVMNIEKAKVEILLPTLKDILKLVISQPQEIGAKCTVMSDKPGHYIVSKMLVYPQVVGPATVEVDEKNLSDWENNLSDSDFNSLRMHFHSHVMMEVEPSATDRKHQEDIVSQLGNNDYYIFLIINKNLKCHWDIYDKRNMIHYETEDVTCIELDAPVYKEVTKREFKPKPVTIKPIVSDVSETLYDWYKKTLKKQTEEDDFFDSDYIK